MSLLQLYQNETETGLMDTYKIILPDGTELMKDCDDGMMDVSVLDSYIGERAVLHIYNNKEHMISEEVTLRANVDSPFGGRVPNYQYDEEEVGPSDEVEAMFDRDDEEFSEELVVDLRGLFDDEDEPDEVSE
jgi:hypothetical protein